MSLSFEKWSTERLPALRELDSARRGLREFKRGTRFAIRQIHESYVVLLASHFQGFCRDLHDECADFFVRTISTEMLRNTVRIVLVLGRKLASGNATPGNIGSDFGRFGLEFWDEVRKLDAGNQDRQKELDRLNAWRNAIAHQHFDLSKLGGADLRLPLLRGWRTVCDRLAVSFDGVMRSHLALVNGVAPW
jgi:hypothetical protein